MITLEQVIEMATQLPARDRLKLAALICEQLTDASIYEEKEQIPEKQKKLIKFDAWLKECEAVANLWEGEFDSAADLRRIRDEED